ncbi:MAG: Gfo/Idh/MocA family oxidoreductase [Chloroflexi bacterium]|nr:Gfo/Idh/MocA family oxidoreductase [Chloroflexota bacterium]
MRIGIMSLAHFHGQSYARAVQTLPGLALAGIADDDGARGREWAARWGVPYFHGYDALLAADVDAVIICAENVRHRDLALRAAAAGKHILCEKPLATTLADAEAMVDACQRAGVKLQTAFPCPFNPAFRAAQRAVAGGAIGTVLAVNGTNRGQYPGDWFADPALAGGGAVMDHTVHVADLLRRLLDDEVARVYAETSHGTCHGAAEDTALLTMEFRRGCFATLDASWSRPRRSYPTWGDVTLEVIGSEGNLSLDLFGKQILLYGEEIGRGQLVDVGANLDGLMVADFAAAIREDRPVTVSGEDGLRALEVALAAYEAARRGEPVELSERSSPAPH